MAAERFTRLSGSHIWTLMSGFYKRLGFETWANERVPSYATCNMVVAQTITHIIQGLVDDVGSSPGAEGRRVTLLEFGSGSGNLMFWVWRLASEHPVLGEWLRAGRLRLVLSDCSERLVRELSGLAPWESARRADMGVDFAVLDATEWRGEAIRTMLHGWDVGEEGETVCGLCGYVFDTLPHDAFHVFGRSLSEVVCSSDASVGPGPDASPDGSRDAPGLEGAGAALDGQTALASSDACSQEAHAPQAARQSVRAGAAERPDAGSRARSASAPSSKAEAPATGRPGESPCGDGLPPLSPEEALRAHPLSWEVRAIDEPATYYRDRGVSSRGPADDAELSATLDAVLGYYRGFTDAMAASSSEHGPTSWPTLPVGGLALLWGLRRLAKGHDAACIVLDKGFADEASFAGLGPPEPATHGAFSLMVNFHACRLAVSACGGAWETTGHESDDIRLAFCTLPPAAARPEEAPSAHGTPPDPEQVSLCGRLPRVAAALSSLPTGGPHAFLHLGSVLPDADSLSRFGAAPQMSLDAILSLCRASGWDSDVFARARPWLARLGREARPDQMDLLLAGVERVIELDYPVYRTKDVPFEAARLMQALGWFKRATGLFRASIELQGVTAASALNLGLCLAALESRQDAAVWLRRAGDLDPDCQGAELAERCEAENVAEASGVTRVRLGGGRTISLGVP